jgi:hypothetical protein
VAGLARPILNALLSGSLASGARALSDLGVPLRAVVRYLSAHTGVPALVVAAILIAVGYRVLKRSARFVLEVALVALVLFAMTELGWIRW